MQIPAGSDLYADLPRPYRNVRWLSVYCEAPTERLRAVIPAPLQPLDPQRRTTLFEVFVAHYGETPELPKYGRDPEITAVSDRLMVLIGQVVVEEVEKAQAKGKNLLAWQFGSLDVMTKHLSHTLAGCVTLLRGQHLDPKDFVIFRRRVFQQLRPAVLALINAELAKAGAKREIPWPSGEERSGHA